MKIKDLIPFRNRKNDHAEPEGTRMTVHRQEPMDRLFADFWRGWEQWPLGDWRTFGARFPNVDVTETSDRVEVTAELPGLAAKEVELTLSARGDTLTVRGESQSETSGNNNGSYWRERSVGTFCRTVDLPVAVRSDDARAVLKDGLLRVELAKQAAGAGAGRRIKVD